MADFTVSMILDMVDRLTKPLRKSNREIGNTAKIADKAQKKLERTGLAGRSFDALTRRVERANRVLNNNALRLRVIGRLQKQLDANEQRRGKLRGKLVGATAAAVATLAPSIVAAKTEEVEIQLRTVLNTDNKDKAMAQARSASRQLAQAGIAGLQESLEIQYGLNSAGLTAKLSAVSAETVAKIATITRGSTGAVTGVMATAYNNLGDSLKGTAEEQFTRIGEIMAKTQLKYKIDNFDQLGESLVQAASAASAAKMPFDQLMVMLGQLNTGGMEGGMGGTGFSATLRQMTKAAEEFGFSMVRGQDGQLDLIATMKGLESALAVYDDIDERNDALQQAFGDEGKKGLIILLKNLKTTQSELKQISEESRGMIDPEFARFKEATTGEWKRFKNTVITVADSFGRTLLPAINAVLSKSSDMLGYIANLAEAFPNITAAITWTVSGLALLRLGFIGTKLAGLLFNASMLTGHLGLLKFAGIMPILSSGLTFIATGIKAVGLAMAANPIGVAVAALGIAAALVIANWDEVKGFLLKIWEPIKPVWEKFITWFSKAWSIISAPLATLGNLLGFGDGPNLKTVTAGQSAAKAIISSPTPAAQALANNPASGNRSISVKQDFNIQAAPGQDAEEIAEAVRRMLERSDPGALYDAVEG